MFGGFHRKVKIHTDKILLRPRSQCKKSNEFFSSLKLIFFLAVRGAGLVLEYRTAPLTVAIPTAAADDVRVVSP